MTQETEQLISNCRALIQNWQRVADSLEVSAKHDEAEGFELTAKATRCSAAALKGCIRGLESVLPTNGLDSSD